MRVGLAKLGPVSPVRVLEFVALLDGQAIVAPARASLLVIAWLYFRGRERNSDRLDPNLKLLRQRPMEYH